MITIYGLEKKQRKTLFEWWHILTLAFGTLCAELDVLEAYLLNIFVDTDGARQAELITECRHQGLHKILKFRVFLQTQHELELTRGRPKCKENSPL